MSGPASSRPAHRDPFLLALVACGGAAGTLVRALLEGAFAAAPGTWPWATFVINVTGSFALGFLLEALVRRGPDAGHRRRLRLGLGTGFLGGYTTYSTLAVEVGRGLLGGVPLVALGYALASLVLGPAAAGAGYLVAGRVPSAPAERAS